MEPCVLENIFPNGYCFVTTEIIYFFSGGGGGGGGLDTKTRGGGDILFLLKVKNIFQKN